MKGEQAGRETESNQYKVSQRTQTERGFELVIGDKSKVQRAIRGRAHMTGGPANPFFLSLLCQKGRGTSLSAAVGSRLQGIATAASPGQRDSEI